MRDVPKNLIRSLLRRFGYALVGLPKNDTSVEATPESDYYRVATALQTCRMMREIHARDVVEIEELYRAFVFPDLPRRHDRAAQLNELFGTTIGEAIYIVRQLHEGLKVPGDVCEFGVAQGATSQLLAAEIMNSGRSLWLFDSFQGLPAPTPEDKLIDDILNRGSMKHYKGTMANAEDQVIGRLEKIAFPRERTHIKKGWIKDTLKSSALPERVAFAYVDLDFYEPIKQALAFLDNRMPVGGRIVVDDYGYFSEGAQLAVDQFVVSAGGRFTFEKPLPFSGHFCILGKAA